MAHCLDEPEKPLEEITQVDLQELIDNRVGERRMIDYKQELHLGSEGERKEFLFDVTSFANAAGGHLIYGVSEEDGYPDRVLGIPVEREDDLILRIESVVRNGISPRARVEVGLVPIAPGASVVILRISASWAKPHMVTFRGTNKFYGRDSRGKYPLAVDEIRGLFSLGATAAERARDFRIDRIATILAGATTPALNDGPATIVHLIPLEAFQPGASLKTLPPPDDVNLRPIRTTGWNPATNFEGIVYFGGGEWAPSKTGTYTQLFRNGAVEAARSWSSRGDGPVLPAAIYEREILDALSRYLEVQRGIGVQPPILVMLTLARMKGVVMELGARARTGDERPFDRSELFLPEAVLDNFDDDVEPVMKRLFDIVWNAAGSQGSPHFDNDGRWIDRD